MIYCLFDKIDFTAEIALLVRGAENFYTIKDTLVQLILNTEVGSHVCIKFLEIFASFNLPDTNDFLIKFLDRYFHKHIDVSIRAIELLIARKPENVTDIILQTASKYGVNYIINILECFEYEIVSIIMNLWEKLNSGDLCNIINTGAGVNFTITYLSQQSELYSQNKLNKLDAHSDFSLIVFLIANCYLSGKVSYTVLWDDNQNCYFWRGFINKPFNIKLVLDQARFIRHKTPKIIASLHEEGFDGVIKRIHKTKQESVSKLPSIHNDPMLFEYTQKYSSSGSSGPKNMILYARTLKAGDLRQYGLSDDMVVKFSTGKPPKNCIVM